MPSTPPGLPAGVDDPAVVIPAAVGPAAEAWNTAAAIVGKNLQICEVRACGVSNHDMGTVRVKTEDTNTKDTKPPNHDPDDGCGSSVACVKLGVPSSSAFSSDGPGNHLRDLWLVIEEPAWECRGDTDRATGDCIPVEHARIYWTDKSGLDENDVPGVPNSYYHYIGSILIHEFGHTLGLPDFSADHTLMNLRAVMENPHKNKTITDEDIAQLRAIYAVHDSSDH